MLDTLIQSVIDTSSFQSQLSENQSEVVKTITGSVGCFDLNAPLKDAFSLTLDSLERSQPSTPTETERARAIQTLNGVKTLLSDPSHYRQLLKPMGEIFGTTNGTQQGDQGHKSSEAVAENKYQLALLKTQNSEREDAYDSADAGSEST